MQSHPHFPQYRVCKNGNIYGPQGLIKPMHRKDPKYNRALAVRVQSHPKPIIDIGVGVMVLETYVGPRPKGHWCLHKNDDHHDNRLSNLYWGTPAQNCVDRRRNGRTAWAKLTPQQTQSIRTRREAGERGADLAREFNVSDQTVCDIYKQRHGNH